MAEISKAGCKDRLTFMPGAIEIAKNSLIAAQSHLQYLSRIETDICKRCSAEFRAYAQGVQVWSIPNARPPKTVPFRSMAKAHSDLTKIGKVHIFQKICSRSVNTIIPPSGTERLNLAIDDDFIANFADLKSAAINRLTAAKVATEKLACHFSR